MDEEFYTARIDESVADLIPEYMRNRQKEAQLLKQYLAAGKLDEIAALAHRMVGVGTPFGFHHVTAIARIMLEMAKAKEVEGLRDVLTEYEHYLRHVQVKIQG